MLKEDPKSLLEALVLPELAAAYRLARSLTGNPTDAQDVVQNAMLRILRFSRTYRGGCVRAWVQSIVRNAAMDWLRCNRRPDHVPIDTEIHGTPDSHNSMVACGESGDPAEIHLREAQIQALRREIAALPPDQRAIVQMRDVEGLSYREIASHLGLRPGTMGVRLLRARARLEERCRSTRSSKTSTAAASSWCPTPD